MKLGREAFAGASDAQWSDWQWQQQNRLRTAGELERYLALTDDERSACTAVAPSFRVAVTPYYLSLIDPDDPLDPVRRQAIPTLAELDVLPSEHEDPQAEGAHEPVTGVVHRYPDRALLYATHNCPVYCRHCFRKRKVSDPTTAASRDELRAGLDYIRHHTEIRDVLLSGGDPLTFSDARLAEILDELRTVPHVEIIRIGTRNPVTLPQRVTPELCGVIRRIRPLYVNTHFNHERECTPEAAEALERLADAGCVLGNQMVLLRGINEDPPMVRRMNHWLLRQRCRPYYIHQCDAARGTAHFRTSIESGLRIIDHLRGWTSGLAVPHYVVDLPGGGGKVPLVPDYLTAADGDRFEFRNYEAERFAYVAGPRDP